MGDASAYVHKDLAHSLKYVVVYRFEGQHVGRDQRLQDGDLTGLHGLTEFSLI